MSRDPVVPGRIACSNDEGGRADGLDFKPGGDLGCPRPRLSSPATTRRVGSTPRGFRRPLVDPDVDLLFVNDGSKDATSSVLAELRASLGGRGSFVDLAWNVGKGRGGPPGDAPRARRWDRGHRIVRLRPGDPARGRVRPPAEARSRTHPR